jgi:para-nitrobenzyl esterase
MNNSHRFLITALVLFCLQVKVSAQNDIVETKYGRVEGYSEENIRIYKGIPFAAPPVGNLRWKAPQPPSSWNGVKKCVAFSASPVQTKPVPYLCWSKEFIAPPAPLSEDCLYLNIWTGAASPKEKRPVFVWIHGGGFISGSTACAVYDGKAYAKNGIVFVSIGYRVGVFGFMAHPELTKEGNGSSGNYGLMDQAAALKWVKENIAAFGGDPDNVTVGGQSAGSISIYCQIASSSSRGLFKRAIGESGGIFGFYNVESLTEGEKTGAALQEKLHAKNIEALRALPADSILAAAPGFSGFHFGPVRDGVFLPADLKGAFKEEKFSQVAFLGGWVTDEMSMFGTKKLSKEEFIRRLQEKYGSRAEKLIALLPHADSAEATQSMVNLTTISFGATSPYTLSKYNREPEYLYEFSHVPTAKPGFPDYGAFHTAEVPYALRNLHEWDRPWRPVDYSIENMMSSYWINFIKTGNPNGPGLPEWQPYRSGVILEFGDQISAHKNLYKELLETLTAD